MIDALIGGKLYGKPSSRTSQQGKPFVVAKVKANDYQVDDISIFSKDRAVTRIVRG